MEQNNKDKDEDKGCLTSFGIFRSLIFILLLLGFWLYYGDWNKAYKMFSREVSEIATFYLWIIGAIIVFVVVIILCGIISSIFDKKKDKH